ncbi:efflux transporter outer membrane subunit [Cupriavidus sp. 2TAF22]|uniref:efflux transporter outer membrane subunit n=1 Tax=unclassified Cupriavidus TaxID=2640874 RepID=UPI003F8FA259
MKPARRRQLAAAGALVLAGCAVGPDYQRPALDVPDAYRFAQSGADANADANANANANASANASASASANANANANANAIPAIDMHWWTQFNDPVLDDLIAKALAQNKDILIALARVEEYYGRLMSTRAGLFPQVGAEIGGGRQRLATGAGNVVPVNNPFNQVRADVFATWEIDLFGRLRRQTESARAQWVATGEARRSTQVSVVAAVATGYISLRDLDNRLLIAQQTLASRQGALTLFQQRFEGGVVSELEVSQAQSEYASALTSVALYEQLVAQQENLLSVLVGQNPADIQRGKSIGELTSPEIPAGLPSALLEQRPDLLQAEQQLIAANAQIGAARAEYFPTISLTGLFGAASTALSGLWVGSARTWSFAGAVSMPIFTAGGIAGDVKQAEARQQQALFAYQQAIQTAFQEVADALVGVQRTREQRAAKDTQVDALQRYVSLAQDRYEGGYTSYLEVLDSQRALFNAQLDQSSLRGSEFGLMVSLYKSLGAGWPLQQADTLANGK